MPQDFGLAFPRDWGQQRVFLLGGGHSLAAVRPRLSRLAERGFVLAINDAWRDCPATAVFSVDHTWLKRNQARIPAIPYPVVVAVDPSHERPPVINLTYLRRQPRVDPPQLSTDPGQVLNLLNSGSSGVDYAVKRGAREIFLLGLDFQPGPGGQSHYHEGYGWHNAPTTGRMYPRWAAILDALKPALDRVGVTVWNCSPRSRLTAYRYRSYEEVLA